MDHVELRDFAMFDINSRFGESPCGTKLPNGWGLFDMHGNVWEWCSDVYVENPYAVNRVPSDPFTSSGSGDRVLRGGSFLDFFWQVRAASRTGSEPDNPGLNPGVRIVVVVSGVRTPK